MALSRATRLPARFVTGYASRTYDRSATGAFVLPVQARAPGPSPGIGFGRSSNRHQPPANETVPQDDLPVRA